MKVAISATGNTLTSEVDPRFGRCAFFLITDEQGGELEAVSNRENADAMGGAGIQAAALVADREVDAVITGHCGPKAFNALQAAQITVYSCDEGSVEEALKKLANKELRALNGPDVQGHW